MMSDQYACPFRTTGQQCERQLQWKAPQKRQRDAGCNFQALRVGMDAAMDDIPRPHAGRPSPAPAQQTQAHPATHSAA
jgi:hypothetical protein